jgi:DNA polymerase-4
MLFYASVEQLDNPDLKENFALLGGSESWCCLLVMKHGSLGFASALSGVLAKSIVRILYLLNLGLIDIRDFNQDSFYFKDYTDLIEPLSR